MQGGKGVREERVSGTLPRTRSQPLNRDVGAGLAPAHPGAVWPPGRAPTRGAPTRLIQQKFPPAGRFVRISLASGRHHAPYLPEYWRVGKTAHRMPGFGEAAGYPGRLGNSAPSPQHPVPSPPALRAQEVSMSLVEKPVCQHTESPAAHPSENPAPKARSATAASERPRGIPRYLRKGRYLGAETEKF